MKFYLIPLLALALASPAGAIVISNPLSLQTQYLVGILNGQPGSSDVDAEKIYAQTILDLSLGEVDGAYAANTVFNYSGTIDDDGDQHGGTSIEAGWDYALAKYDGDKGGYVLFFINGEASTIPQFPYLLWTDKEEQYGISHYTLFNSNGGPPPPPPPPPPPVPEGGVPVGLFGLVLAGIGLLRLKLGSSFLGA